jgi:hypothetical protein
LNISTALATARLIGEGCFVHVVAGIFSAQVVALTEHFTSQLFSQSNPRFHHCTGIDLAVPHRLKALLR